MLYWNNIKWSPLSQNNDLIQLIIDANMTSLIEYDKRRYFTLDYWFDMLFSYRLHKRVIVCHRACCLLWCIRTFGVVLSRFVWLRQMNWLVWNLAFCKKFMRPNLLVAPFLFPRIACCLVTTIPLSYGHFCQSFLFLLPLTGLPAYTLLLKYLLLVVRHHTSFIYLGRV